MKNYSVELIEQRAITLNIKAKSQPEAVKQAYAYQSKLDDSNNRELVRIRAKQRFN